MPSTGMRLAFVASLGLAMAGCSSARMSNRAIDDAFYSRDYAGAEKKLQEGLEKEGEKSRDYLLYLLDLGLTQHTAGKYAESVQTLLLADKIAEIKDYTSISKETATLLTSDNIKDYRAEEFEYVLISTYLAIGFAMEGKWESAQVEARRVNHKLEMLISEGKRKYEQNAFARYLSGILYEIDGDYNNAHVSYQKVLDLDPATPGLGLDLWRMAYQLRMRDMMEKWESRFNLSKADLDRQKAFVAKKSEQGEIIVIFQNGLSPIKRPDPGWNAIPKFYPRHNPVVAAKVLVDGVDVGATYRLYDIESAAIRNLDEKWGGLLAKKIGGVVAKEVVGKQIENVTDSPLLGLLAKVALHASDQADLRSWSLLPKDLQILRVPVAAGVHTVRLEGLGDRVWPAESTVQVGAKRRVFVSFRYVP